MLEDVGDKIEKIARKAFLIKETNVQKERPIYVVYPSFQIHKSPVFLHRIKVNSHDRSVAALKEIKLINCRMWQQPSPSAPFWFVFDPMTVELEHVQFCRFDALRQGELYQDQGNITDIFMILMDGCLEVSYLEDPPFSPL